MKIISAVNELNGVPYQVLVGGRPVLTINYDSEQIEFSEGVGAVALNRTFCFREVQAFIAVPVVCAEESSSVSLVIVFECGAFGTVDWWFVGTTDSNKLDVADEVRNWVRATNSQIWQKDDQSVANDRQKLARNSNKKSVKDLLAALSGEEIGDSDWVRNRIKNLRPCFIRALDRYFF